MRLDRPRFLLIVCVLVACSSSNPVREPPRPEAGVDASQPLPQDADTIPCAPRAVLQAVCQRCHTRPPQNGAPFPLVNRSDILATHSGAVVRDLMIEQVTAGRMPLSPVTMTDEQREILLDWLEAGAPAVSPQACSAGTQQDGGADAAGD